MSELTTKHVPAKKRATSRNPEAVTVGLYGKVPPQAEELERSVLGAIMLEKHAFDVVSEILKAECFYRASHQDIFRTMASLSHRNNPIDLISVVQELRTNGNLDSVGGPIYITKLTQDVVSSANIEYHARIVLEKYMLRELAQISGRTMTSAYDDGADIFDILDDYDKSVTSLTSGSLTKSYVELSGELVKRISRIEELRHKQEHITGVPAGFRDLDRITHGWQPTDLIILAARPSVGKTAFALNLARNAAMNKIRPVPVAFFSLEMSTGQLTDRLLSSESEIWLERITNGNLDESHMQTLYQKAVRGLEATKIFIDDTPAIDLYQLKSKCRNLKRKHDVGLFVLDYLQLMSGASDKRSGNREQEISTISRGLKAIAKELNVPFIALSQLSRAPETRKGENKMPVLSDLRESGAIEQDADMVIFMYRPEYYGEKVDEMGESVEGETHINIAKHRNGKRDVIKLRANLAIQKFSDLESPGDLFRPLTPMETAGMNSVINQEDGDSYF